VDPPGSLEALELQSSPADRNSSLAELQSAVAIRVMKREPGTRANGTPRCGMTVARGHGAHGELERALHSLDRSRLGVEDVDPGETGGESRTVEVSLDEGLAGADTVDTGAARQGAEQRGEGDSGRP